MTGLRRGELVSLRRQPIIEGSALTDPVRHIRDAEPDDGSTRDPRIRVVHVVRTDDASQHRRQQVGVLDPRCHLQV